MKSIPKLIRRFVGIMTVSVAMLVPLNFIILAIAVSMQSPYGSPWNTANEAAADLKKSENAYFLSNEMSAKLMEQDVWAILIAENTQRIIWHTGNLPADIPNQYTLSDIADFTRGYIDGYPTFTGETEDGLLVLGYPKDSFWKHTRATWDYRLIANAPLIALLVLAGNIAVIFLIYLIVNSKLLRSVKPITNSIQDLPTGISVYIQEKGLFSELAENINKTSAVLQEQREELQKKDTARANWIAGVSHDIRTPLSMVMGYAGQLANAQDIPDAERKKASIILKQSDRMKNLINDLNLASKLEYNMQPMMSASENAVAIVRQVVVDFMNMDIENKFPLEWQTADELSTCAIKADKDLIKRAVANLIQNSMSHNENGCTIFVNVEDAHDACSICIEDNGVGVSDEQLEALNTAQHYMVCDTNTTEQRHGLGLLIVNQIVAAHHGEMRIAHSAYGGFKAVLIFPKYIAAHPGKVCVNEESKQTKIKLK